MEELLNEQSTEIRSLKHGDVVEGTVVRIDKDEILVDIGAKSEGVVSNRELYGRNTESQPELNIGDVVLVYVLQPESHEGHAVLSLRRAGLERKWRAMQEQLDAGVIIEAPVIDHNKGGLIVDCGIRGFVPISQIVDFPRRPQNEQPRDAAQEIAEKLQPYVGRKLRLKILEVNRKANRLILSEKVALYEERREKRDELFSSLQVGQKVTGTVRSIAPFGVFVDLGGIDGLVHKSELSWNKVNNPEAGYHVGEEVEAEVIDINHERGRISLSIRRLQPDPWHSTVADLKVGDVIDGTVTKIVNFGAFVRVRDGLEGLIHISELSHQRVAHPGDVVHEGQTLKLKVISLDSERHRLGLSLKQAEEAPAPAPRAAPASGASAGRAAERWRWRTTRARRSRSPRAASTTRWPLRSRRSASRSRRPRRARRRPSDGRGGTAAEATADAEATAEAEAAAAEATAEPKRRRSRGTAEPRRPPKPRPQPRRGRRRRRRSRGRRRGDRRRRSDSRSRGTAAEADRRRRSDRRSRGTRRRGRAPSAEAEAPRRSRRRASRAGEGRRVEAADEAAAAARGCRADRAAEAAAERSETLAGGCRGPTAKPAERPPRPTSPRRPPRTPSADDAAPPTSRRPSAAEAAPKPTVAEEPSTAEADAPGAEPRPTAAVAGDPSVTMRSRS